MRDSRVLFTVNKEYTNHDLVKVQNIQEIDIFDTTKYL